MYFSPSPVQRVDDSRMRTFFFFQSLLSFSVSSETTLRTCCVVTVHITHTHTHLCLFLIPYILPDTYGPKYFNAVVRITYIGIREQGCITYFGHEVVISGSRHFHQTGQRRRKWDPFAKKKRIKRNGNTERAGPEYVCTNNRLIF